MEENALQTQIEITEKAAEEIQKIRDDNKIPITHGLRVGIKGGGCGGMNYLMGFDEKAKESDQVFESAGLKIFVDNNSVNYLLGAQLDFKENEFGKGFVFNNVKKMDQKPNGECGDGACCC